MIIILSLSHFIDSCLYDKAKDGRLECSLLMLLQISSPSFILGGAKAILLSHCSLRVVKVKPSGNGLICRYVVTLKALCHDIRAIFSKLVSHTT